MNSCEKVWWAIQIAFWTILAVSFVVSIYMVGYQRGKEEGSDE
jgi:hypothetical protein